MIFIYIQATKSKMKNQETTSSDLIKYFRKIKNVDFMVSM